MPVELTVALPSVTAVDDVLGRLVAIKVVAQGRSITLPPGWSGQAARPGQVADQSSA